MVLIRLKIQIIIAEYVAAPGVTIKVYST